MVTALHEVGLLPCHVVTQVVKAELVVGAVGDVSVVLLAALRRLLLGDDAADVHAEETVDTAHQLALVAGEVVVDGDHVHALAFESVQIGGQGGDQGLAFTGLHFGDVAPVQGSTAHELHVEVTLAKVRLETSRTVANASGMISSRLLPFSISCLTSGFGPSDPRQRGRRSRPQERSRPWPRSPAS